MGFRNIESEAFNYFEDLNALKNFFPDFEKDLLSLETELMQNIFHRRFLILKSCWLYVEV